MSLSKFVICNNSIDSVVIDNRKKAINGFLVLGLHLKGSFVLLIVTGVVLIQMYTLSKEKEQLYSFVHANQFSK